jgi:hypothetical protein
MMVPHEVLNLSDAGSVAPVVARPAAAEWKNLVSGGRRCGS